MIALDMADSWEEVKPHLVRIVTAIRDSLPVLIIRFGVK